MSETSETSTKSAYQRRCEETCQWCAIGAILSLWNNRWHAGDVQEECTAPTLEEFCEEQAARIAELEEQLAVKISFLHNYEHAVKLDREDYERRIAELEQDKARLLNALESILGNWFVGKNSQLMIQARAAIDAARSK